MLLSYSGDPGRYDDVDAIDRKSELHLCPPNTNSKKQQSGS